MKNNPVTIFILVIILAGIIYYFAVVNKPKVPTGTATALKPKNTTGKTGSAATAAQEVDSSGNVSAGMTVVSNYDITCPVVKASSPGGYVPGTDSSGAAIADAGFNAWDLIGTIALIDDEGGDNEYALVPVAPKAAWNLFGADPTKDELGNPNYYKVSVYDCQQQ